MSLNKSTGHMFDYVTHTWNPIRGKCPHGCSYCYMKGKPVGELRLDEEALKDSLGLDGKKTIFVGSSVDMWAYGKDGVPAGWISRVLSRCREFPDNTYAFLTKNPARYGTFFFEFPPDTMLGITLETNEYQDDLTEAPDPISRAWELAHLPPPPWKLTKFVSVEPIMDFLLERDPYGDPLVVPLPELIHDINPAFVSIGADSKKHKLPEPPAKKVWDLVERLSGFTEVRLKPNLQRIIGGAQPEPPNEEGGKE